MQIFNKIAIILLIALIFACTQQSEKPQQDELVKSVNVETKTLKPRPFERYIKLVGNVEANQDVKISAEIAGRILRYYVEKGDEVKKDQPIAKIDDSQLKREKERLEAVTGQARENFERLERLYKEENVGSEIEYLNARYKYQQNKAALESVKESINKTTVRAPFDATLEDKMVEEGEMVSPGMVMARLIGVNRLKVSAGVPARFSDVVDRGDRAQVWFDFAENDTLRLPITFVGNSIDQQARTFKVEVLLPRNNRNYKVDMISNIKIRTFRADDVLVMNKEFLYQKEGGYVAYKFGKNENGKKVAIEVPVELGPSYENRVVIEKGLQPGDKLITVGSSFVQDNMRVNVVSNQEGKYVQG